MLIKDFQKKQELIAAALNEFCSKSYDEASLNRIIEKAGISKGSFYYHYGSKENLYFALLTEIVEKKLQFFQQWSGERAQDLADKDIFSLLLEQQKGRLEFVRCYPEYYRLAQMFVLEKNIEIKDKAKAYYGASTDDYLEPLLQAAWKKGEIRNDIPYAFVKRLMSFLLLNFDAIFIKDKQEVNDEQLGQEYLYFISFIRDGLGKKN